MAASDSNTERFRALVREYGLPLTEIAVISGRSYQRVRDWHSGKYHTIPAEALELLEHRLMQRSKGTL